MQKTTCITSSATLALALTLVGCAGIPRSDAPESKLSELSCPQLASTVAQNEQTKRAAVETRASAWTVIVPVAAIARYAKASSAIAESDKRAAELAAHQQEKGCAS